MSPSADPVTNMVSLLSMAIHFTWSVICEILTLKVWICIVPHVHGPGRCEAACPALSPKDTPDQYKIKTVYLKFVTCATCGAGVKYFYQV